MSDEERFGPVFESWLRDTDVPAPDAEPTIHRVATRLPETPQLRRRKWLPSFVRAWGSVPTTEETTDYQPSPIPAMNGHTPTVIGRTTSMLSPVKAITAGAIVFAIGGVMLIAQPFDERGGSVPGVATDVEMETPVEFTAKWGFFGGSVLEATADGSDPTRWRDGVMNVRIIEPASDPSFVGDVTLAYNYDEYGSSGDLMVSSNAFTVENDVGTWRGVPQTSLTLPTGDTTGDTQIFIGERGYDGFYAAAELTTTLGQGVDVHGFIFEGEPPPAAQPFVTQ